MIEIGDKLMLALELIAACLLLAFVWRRR